MAYHNRFIDQLMPIVEAYDAWAIIVMNEADNHVKDNPNLIGEYTGITQARDYIHSRNPNMAVAATLTAYLQENIELVRPMIDESDFAGYNFYCAGAALTETNMVVQRPTRPPMNTL